MVHTFNGPNRGKMIRGALSAPLPPELPPRHERRGAFLRRSSLDHFPARTGPAPPAWRRHTGARGDSRVVNALVGTLSAAALVSI
jgi:hypothetical protein